MKIGTADHYERNTREIREIVGRTVSESTIKQYIKSYQVVEYNERAKGLPENACSLISRHQPESDWSILIEKALKSKHPSAEVEKLIKKTKKIRNMINEIPETKTRDLVSKQIEPIIYEKEMTVGTAEEVIAKTLGIYLERPLVITLLKPFIENAYSLEVKLKEHYKDDRLTVQETEEDNKTVFTIKTWYYNDEYLREEENNKC